jgi:DNA-binding NarL/FixJ family response regulator
VRGILGDLASQIHDYADGLDAVARFDHDRPDWAIVDVAMPTVDGFTLTAWIRSRHPKTRVAIMTQYDNPKLRARAGELGAAAFVLKDDLQQLRRLLVCHRPPPPQPAPISPAHPLAATPTR